jgi:hypothetical protein
MKKESDERIAPIILSPADSQTMPEVPDETRSTLFPFALTADMKEPSSSPTAEELAFVDSLLV